MNTLWVRRYLDANDQAVQLQDLFFCGEISAFIAKNIFEYFALKLTLKISDHYAHRRHV